MMNPTRDDGPHAEQSIAPAESGHESDLVPSLPATRAAAYSRLSEICNAFEDAWNPQDPPRIDDYFFDSSELLRQLILADLDARLEHGMHPQKSDYTSRFPSHTSVIDAAFAEHGATSSTQNDPSTRKSTTPDQVEADPTPVPSAASGHSPLEDADEPTTPDKHHAAVSNGTTDSTPRIAGERYLNWEELGRGGIGVVYKAHDDQLDRPVAVKVNRMVHGHAGQADTQVMLVREAQITGKLEHKGVAPVFECGQQSHRQPFYAMRLIEGFNLQEGIAALHADDRSGKQAVDRPGSRNGAKDESNGRGMRKRNLRDYLRSFIDVCHTIAFAHSRGVLNCDIKPANIRIGKYGETFVVDWGLAELLAEIGGEQAADDGWIRPRTALKRPSGSAGGTTQFMSPEQAGNLLSSSQQPANWRALDQRSDVYSLGATLFTLLTGKHSVSGASRHEKLTNVYAGDVSAPADVSPAVPPALDAVCRKAMSLCPDDRYATALELAADVELWLADECPRAYEDEEPYRDKMFRWIRNNRRHTMTIAAGLLVGILSLCVATMLVEAARERESRWRAEALARYVDSREAIDRWVTGASESLRFFPGTQALRIRLLKQAASDYERLAATRSDDVDLEFEQGRGQIRLGNVYANLEDPDSLTQAEQCYLTAIDRFEQLRGRYGRETLDIEIARAEVKLGQLMMSAQRLDGAQARFEAAVQRLAALAVNNGRVGQIIAAARLERGLAFAQAGDDDTAREEIEDAVQRYRELTTADPVNQEFRHGLAIARTELGRRHEEHGEHALAIEQYEAAAALLTKLVALAPDQPEYLSAQASLTTSMATIHRLHGRQLKLQEALRTVAASYQALHAAAPDVPHHRANLAKALTNLGIAAIDQGESKRAAEQLARPFALYRELVASHGIPEYRRGLATCAVALGVALSDLEGQQSQAEAVLTEAVTTFRALQGQRPDDHDVIASLALAWAAFAATSSDVQAKSLFEAATKNLTALGDVAPKRLEYQSHQAHVLHEYGLWLDGRDEQSMAAEKFLAARQTWQALLDQSAIPAYQNAYAWFLVTCPDPNIRLPDKAVEFATKARHAAPENATFCHTLAAAQFRAGRIDESLVLLEEAVRLRGIPNARDWFFLSMVRYRLDQPGEARAAYEEGAAWMAEHQPRDVVMGRIRSEAGTMIGVETVD